MSLVLIGMKKCGKSTLGRRLARCLDWRFEDVDARIESLYQARYGQELAFREIFRKHGANFFEDLEDQALRMLGEEISCQDKQAVVSLGGRTAMNTSLHEIIRRLGKVIYLQVSPDLLLERILDGELPAFLDPQDPQGSFHRIFAERKDCYEALADRIVNLDGLDEQQSLDKLVGDAQELINGR